MDRIIKRTEDLMEIRVLRYFTATAQEESMTRAALRLHVTQPTLSRQLAQLEDELGQKLFQRSNYSIRLTMEGQILYKRALDILSMVDRTTKEFESMNDFNGGDVYIGCAESEGISYIGKAAKRLRDTYENIRFHLYSGNAETVTERLNKGLLDFAIVVQAIDTTKYHSIEIPSKDTWGLIMRKDSPLAEKTTISKEDLLKLPLITSRQGITSEMPSWFRENQDHLNIVATYDLLYNASVLVKEGLGYALGFDKLVNTGADSVLTSRPIVPIIESPMKIIWSYTQILSRAATLFLDEFTHLLQTVEGNAMR